MCTVCANSANGLMCNVTKIKSKCPADKNIAQGAILF